MKKIIFSILSILFMGIFTGCLDKFEEVNSNPDKLYQTSAQLILPGTIYRTMNVYAEMNYTKLLNYSRGGRVAYAEIGLSESDINSYTTAFYVNILRDLLDLETQYEGIESAENRLMMIKTWKAFVYSIIVGIWGPMPMSDAMIAPNKLDYKYDTEKDMYIQIFDLLKTATERLNPVSANDDFLNPDPVFGGAARTNIEKWRKFANTLRLDLALRVENIDKALAEQQIRECMEHEDWIIASVDDMVQPTWGSTIGSDVSYYYTRLLQNLTDANLSESTYPRIGQYMFTYLRSYNDPRLEKYVDRPGYEDRLIINDTINIIRKSEYSGLDTTLNVISRHTVPYAPGQEHPGTPQTWEAGFDPNSNNGAGTGRYQNPYGGIPKKGWAYVNISFLDKNAKLNFLNWASACFIKAEVKLKYGIGQKSVQEYYEEGITASFRQYGISGEELNAYMAQDGVKWGTNGKGLDDYMQIYFADINGADNPLEQIVKQRWIAEYFNGFAGWILERRTRIFNFPPMLYNGSQGLEGSNGRFDYPPERLIYSINERSTNNDEYEKAIQLLQAASPKGDRVNRWGDNLWTHLQFAKVNPGLADAEAKWTGRVFVWNQHALQNRYGKTEEEMIKIAQKEFSQITDTTGLQIYLKYTIEEIIVPRP
ncbi:MAG: SusD/RagB family nutrient-binding outer membrane lipoprotein [Dysgonamonadaceae bacterium]|jgi:hypothetical protein|nr:SusD/RagB family nutrient-binding outer membrane lipoprotein [Dysgonamonadaceae bacterium]